MQIDGRADDLVDKLDRAPGTTHDARLAPPIEIVRYIVELFEVNIDNRRE